jgi:hypothetical protein
MPRRDAPVGGRPKDGIVVKARELRPQEFLPKIRINGDRETQRSEESGQKDGDELSEAEVRFGEGEKPCCGEEDG